MQVEVVKLSDGQLSVRLDGNEVAILPRRSECTPDHLERAIRTVLQQAEGGEW